MDGDANEDCDKQLPRRLFATDRFPAGRLNMYGEASTLTFLHHTLKGTAVFQRLRDSSFGRLFDFPMGRCPYSGKLIHSLLSRQLLTKRKYEFWTVFGGQPFRFSLPEFCSITGLPCGPWPEGYHPQKASRQGDAPDKAWKSILGTNKNTTCQDIADWLTADKGKDLIEPERKFKLALLLIVDGVLKANTLPLKPTPHYVSMLSDVDAFLKFPWARESFFWTLHTMKPGVKIFGETEDPVEAFRDKLKGGTYRLMGFPLALQLLAFRVVPNLLQKLRDPREEPTLLAIDGPLIPIKGYISNNTMLLVEHAPNLKVTPLLPLQDETIAAAATWPDEQADNKVAYLENQIAAAHQFTKQEWPGGDASLPLLTPRQPKRKRVANQPIVRRKQQKTSPTGVNNNQSSVRKKVDKQAKPPLYDVTLQDAIQNNQFLREQLENLNKKIQILTRKHAKLFQLFRETRRAVTISNIRRRQYNIKSKRPPEKTKPVNYGPECCPINWFASPARKTDASQEDDKGLDDEGLDDRANYTLTDMNGGNFSPPLSQYVATKLRVEENQCSTLPDKLATSPPLSQYVATKLREEENQCSTLPDKFATDINKGLFEDTPETPPKNCDSLLEHTELQPLYDLTNPRQTTSPPIEVEQQASTPTNDCTIYLQPIWDNSNVRHAETNEHTLVLSDSSPPPARQNDSPTDADIRLLTHLHLKEPSPYNVQNDETAEDALVLSDSSPPPARQKHSPSDAEIRLVTHLQLKEPTPYNDLLPPLDDKEFNLFQEALLSSPNLEHHTHLRLDFDNQFLLDLAKPQKWVSTQHMEVLMDWLANRHQTLPKSEAGAFCSPHLVNHILSKGRSFSAAKNKMQVGWEGRIGAYVTTPGRAWGLDTDTVYAPMIWNNKHWVGLAININLGVIEVLDPYPDLTADRNVEKHLKPLLNMLPYIVHKLCPSATQSNGLKPYTWTRLQNLYQNKRGGDCGPVAVKFMEIYAAGDPAPHMAGIDDATVDKLRKQYAIDIFHELVIPTYFAN